MSRSLGALREQIVIQTPAPADLSVTSITRSGAVATVTMAAPHGWTTGIYVTIAGATPDGYTGRVKITVTGATTFTYPVSAGLSTPASGTITATYTSDAQGGRSVVWRTLDAVAAALETGAGQERLLAAAVQAQQTYQFRIRTRTDLTPAMRVLWTPSWASVTARKTLEIQAVRPVDDGRHFQVLDLAEVA